MGSGDFDDVIQFFQRKMWVDFVLLNELASRNELTFRNELASVE